MAKSERFMVSFNSGDSISAVYTKYKKRLLGKAPQSFLRFFIFQAFSRRNDGKYFKCGCTDLVYNRFKMFKGEHI